MTNWCYLNNKNRTRLMLGAALALAASVVAVLLRVYTSPEPIPDAAEPATFAQEPSPFDSNSFVVTTLQVLNQIKADNAAMRAELQRLGAIVDAHVREGQSR